MMATTDMTVRLEEKMNWGRKEWMIAGSWLIKLDVMIFLLIAFMELFPEQQEVGLELESSSPPGLFNNGCIARTRHITLSRNRLQLTSRQQCSGNIIFFSWHFRSYYLVLRLTLVHHLLSFTNYPLMKDDEEVGSFVWC